MGIEIERKFLVRGAVPEGECSRIVQAYLCLDPERTVRIRIDSESAFITVKGATVGASRSEFEYAIPIEDAAELLKLCVGKPIEKVRHRVAMGPHLWEIDVFGGANAGLVVAEIELASESEMFDRPGWLGEEVTSDSRYLNACLAQNPYESWGS